MQHGPRDYEIRICLGSARRWRVGDCGSRSSNFEFSFRFNAINASTNPWPAKALATAALGDSLSFDSHVIARLLTDP